MMVVASHYILSSVGVVLDAVLGVVATGRRGSVVEPTLRCFFKTLSS